MYGAVFDNQMVAMLLNQTVFFIFNFGAGVFTNLGPGASWIVKFIGYISPFRYQVEYLLRVLLKGLPYVDQICDYF